MAIMIVIVLDPCLCAGYGVSDVETAYSLFNERGYYKASSFTTDGEEIINNFNGNLVYTKTLDYLPTSANGIQQLLQICYNGSVGHILSTGPDATAGCTKQVSVSAPEWIISMNGYALQTFNFENDFVSLKTPTFTDPDSTSAHEDVALLINGYHTCHAASSNPDRFTILMADGSVKTLQSYDTSFIYFTMSEDDRTKARIYRTSPDTLLVYNDDGTRVKFATFRPIWRTNNQHEIARADILLPVAFMDRFGNSVPVEYYFYLTDSSGAQIQGHPILKRVGNYWFDWGEGFLDSVTENGWTNQLKIYSYESPESCDSLLYTISMADLEAGATVVETIGDRNRGLVTHIVDRLNRAERFSYARYKRLGTDIIGLSECAGNQIAPNFYIEPFRLFARINMAGGLTRYKYLDDDSPNVCSFSWWPSTLSYSVGVGQYEVSEVDFDHWRDCAPGGYPLHPCHRSDAFMEYGRDPFFVNMVVARARYVCKTGRYDSTLSVVSYDSLVFSWIDPNEDDDSTYTSENDTLTTLWVTDSSDAYIETPLKRSIFKFGTYKEPWGTALTRNRGYSTKLLSSLTKEFTGTGGTTDTTSMTVNHWRLGTVSGRLLLDSTDTYQDGQLKRTRYEYAHVSTTEPLYPAADTLVNIIKKSEIDAFDIKTTTYYNDDYFDPSAGDSFYSNTLIDSQIVEGPLTGGIRRVLAKTYRSFCADTSSLGYVGQVRTEAAIEFLRPGLVVDTLTTHYEYYKNVGDTIPAGSLKRSTDPMGNFTDYLYYGRGADSTVRVVDTLERADTIGGASAEVDSFYVECEGAVDYHLALLECSSEYSVARIEGTGWSIEIRGNGEVDDSSGTVAVGPDEWVYLSANLSSTDPGSVRASSIIHDCGLEELVCPVKYYRTCTDGSADTVWESFGDRGPFWYKQLSYLESDTITTYQLVDSLGLPRKYVSANGFLSEITWDEVRRMETVTLPYGFSPTSGSQYTIKNVYTRPLGNVSGEWVHQYSSQGPAQSDKHVWAIFDGFWRNQAMIYYYLGGTTHGVSHKHDCLDRLIETEDQLHHTTATVLDALDRTIRITYPDPSLSEVNQSYDTTSFAGELADYPFDVPSDNSYLWVTKTLSENGDSTKSYADALGRQRGVKQFVGDSVYTTYLDYDELGSLLTVQKPKGDRVHYEYDLLGRMTRQWSADSDTAEFVYDRNGNVVLRKDGNLTAEDEVGDTVLFKNTWVSVNWQIPGDDIDTIVIDRDGFITFELSFSYLLPSEPGTFASIALRDGASAPHVLCTLNKDDTVLSKEGQFNVSQGDTVVIFVRYDINETSGLHSVNAFAYYYVIEESESWIYSHYDALNRPTENGLVRLKDSCDADSCWISDTLAHSPINLLYYDQPQSINSRGKLSVAYTNDNGYQYAERYHYDARGRVSDKLNIFDVHQDTLIVSDPTTQFPGDTFTVSYEYDQSDKVTKIRYPNDTVVTFHYDMRGRLASIGDLLDADKYATITYTARDEIEQIILGDSLQLMDYEYNERGWLTSINGGIAEDTSSDMFGEILEYYGTARDTAWPAYYNGNIAAQKLAFSRSDTIVHLYEYDQIDRLVDAHMGTASDTAIGPYREYTYDKNGNRLSLNIDGGPNEWTYVYNANSNQLASTGYLGSLHTAYTYDASGNVDSSDFLYTYDLYNQLNRVDTSGGSAYLRFGYSVAGERIWKEYHWAYLDSTGGDDSIPIFPLGMMMMGGGGGVPPQIVQDSSITWYIRGADGKVLAEYDPLDSTYLHTFIYAGDQRIAMFDKLGALHFYLNDHLGSARRVIAANGTPKDKYVYHPYGGESSSTVNTLQTRRYTGKPLDEEMGLDLYYYGARYYDPELGRFTQMDPLAGQYPGWGPYVYCGNNPLSNLDRDGQAWDWIPDAISIGLSAADMWNDPSWENAGWLAADIVLGVVPFVPAVGVVRHADKIADVLKLGDKAADAIKAGDKAVDAAKKVPNPHGRKGGPAHQRGVDEAAEKAKVEFPGGKPRKEGRIDTPGGTKGKRYGDVVVYDKNGKAIKVYQVGETLADGVTPVKREREALGDILRSGAGVEFIPKQ